jgi:putative tricarboxylic transport membrane protein
VLTNWRSVMAPPGITPEQRAALEDLVAKMVKSAAWQAILKQKGWDNAYLSGDKFKEFLTFEGYRVRGVLVAIGLVR